MFRAARGLSLKKSIRKTSCTLNKFPRCARLLLEDFMRNVRLSGVLKKILRCARPYSYDWIYKKSELYFVKSSALRAAFFLVNE